MTKWAGSREVVEEGIVRNEQTTNLKTGVFNVMLNSPKWEDV